ncbi:inositol monophosphatase family protein [Jeotgalibacillus sp. R-1-5s-1]|uniref:inositol monophosphatase family protein n=1 Tax=Jeotgalibacillus sp. R-1-5s-1 TaxID=2555897 RepID=UPI00106A36A4|nr:inositol monophosphatase family protein [Jeotgalibacillus sp. R-1-5s-1]TFE03633.1 inositol monophosphatase family protein [Jeotgalibacillus sp. R-1-5s-1]
MNQTRNEMDRFAKELIKRAGQTIIKSFDDVLNIETKSNANDLVTNMDKQIERFFVKEIQDKYPDHKILGEEGFGDQVKSLDGTVWIIDPIDGTMNFVHQQRNFAISIGVYEEGEGILGYIYDVVHDELYWASKGEGAYLNDKKLSPLKEVKLEESILALNATWVAPHERIPFEAFTPLVRKARGTRSYGSAALELAYIATGGIDGYMTMRLAPWDVAGGKVIIEEVGGKMTDLSNNPLNLIDSSPVFAGNASLHDEIYTEYLSKYFKS